MTALAVILYLAFLWLLLTIAIVVVVSLVKYQPRRGINGP